MKVMHTKIVMTSQTLEYRGVNEMALNDLAINEMAISSWVARYIIIF